MRAEDLRDGDEIPRTAMTVDGSRFLIWLCPPLDFCRQEVLYDMASGVDFAATDLMVREFAGYPRNAATLRELCAWLAREYPA